MATKKIEQTIMLAITSFTQTGTVSLYPGSFLADGESAGFITAADKVKLDTIQPGAEPNLINSIYILGTEVIPDTTGRVSLNIPIMSFYGNE